MIREFLNSPLIVLFVILGFSTLLSLWVRYCRRYSGRKTNALFLLVLSSGYFLALFLFAIEPRLAPAAEIEGRVSQVNLRHPIGRSGDHSQFEVTSPNGLRVTLDDPIYYATPRASTQETVAQSKETELEREKVTVTRLGNDWLNALNSANVNAIAEVLADDFVRPSLDYGHFVTKADLLSHYRLHLTPQGSDHRRIEDMTVTVYGSTALARGVLTTTNSEGHLIRRLLFTDVFVKREGRWQAVSAQEDAVPTPVTPTR